MADRVSVSVNICAPGDLVYRLVSDLPRMGEWSPESTGGRWLTASGGRVGARFFGRNRNGRRRWSTLSTVTAAEPGRRFAFRVSAPLVPISDWEYTIEPTATGCRVEEIWTDRRPIPVRLISTARTGVAARLDYNRTGMERTLVQIKATAESAATPASDG